MLQDVASHCPVESDPQVVYAKGSSITFQQQSCSDHIADEIPAIFGDSVCMYIYIYTHKVGPPR